MKKNIIALLILLLFEIGAYTQIKPFVGVVREQYSDETLNKLKDFQEYSKEKRNRNFSNRLREFFEGTGFGSGFVYKGSDNKNYILTNTHVVRTSDYATIEFENEETGEFVKYSNLKVVKRSPDLDLTLLSFPNDEQPFKEGLVISGEKLYDGDEVWAAGFPGLGNTPMWQLGKGNITNSHVRIKEMTEHGITSFIQHSAQVHPGNSGGPLLKKNPRSSAGFDVVGINTWKAYNRDSTNFSLPAEIINKFLQTYFGKPNSNYEKEELKRRVKNFCTGLKDMENEYDAIYDFVSIDKILEMDFDEWFKLLSNGNTNITNSLAYDPLKAIACAFAKSIWKSIAIEDADNEYSFEIKNFQIENNKPIEVILKDKTNKEIKTTWQREYGDWVLYDIDIKPETKEKKSKPKKAEKKATYSFFSLPDDNDMIFVNSYGANIPLKGTYEENEENKDCKLKGGFSASLEETSRFFGMGLSYDTQITDFDHLKLLGVNISLQVPINLFNKVSLIPYGKLSGNWAILSDDAAYGYSYECGLNLLLYKSMFGLNCSYKNIAAIALNDSCHNYRNQYIGVKLVFFTE